MQTPREPEGGRQSDFACIHVAYRMYKSTQTPKRLRNTIVRVNPKAHMLTPRKPEGGKAVHICAAACTKRVRDPPANRRPRNQK